MAVNIDLWTARSLVMLKGSIQVVFCGRSQDQNGPSRSIIAGH